MSTKKKQLSRRYDPEKLLLLLIPAAAYFIPGLFIMGASDTLYTARFMFTLLIFAAASYPLTVMLFPGSRSGGFTFGKPLGFLACGLAVWTLTYLKIGKLNLLFIILSVIVLAFACWYPKDLRENAIDALRQEDTLTGIVTEETIFALVMTMLCFYKGMNPNINGQEKFMDYGFMMSMIRNPELPANDMWLSGYSINYYYFGQYIYAFLTKLSLITPGIAYNISMCCSIALPFAMCFAIGRMLIDSAREQGLKCPGYVGVIGGVLTAFAAMIFGNSHSFFYDENSIGNGLLDIFTGMGIDVGRTDHFFYPDSTRFIGHNPDSSLIEGIANGGDYTIEEFPFYSYLIGDLHAHVCSIINVLLIIALSVSLISRIYKAADRKDIIDIEGNDPSLKEKILTALKSVLQPELIAIAVLLGICQMTNYWDFLIYFIFGSMVLLIYNIYASRKFCTVLGAVFFFIIVGGILGFYLAFAYQPLIHALFQLLLLAVSLYLSTSCPSALTRTATGMSFLFTTATVVSLPFNMNFDMISNKLGACVNHSPMYQLFILWGTHVIICVTFLVFVIIFRKHVELNGKKAASVTYNNPVSKFLMQRNPMDVLVCGSIVVGILLLIAPEIFYVRDIYTGGYLRSNTMFKFTYAAFIILSICMIYAVLRLMFMETPSGQFSTVSFIISIVFCFMLLVPAHYTLVSLRQRCGSLSRDNYKYLDGTRYLLDYTSPYNNNVRPGNLTDYYNCIEWLNENVEGDPVILEAYGLSYTDYNIVSAYTGLPTVCGWQTHEWLWRYHGIVDPETDLLVSDPEHDVWELYLNPRHADIDTMYTSDDPEVVFDLLSKYNVQYVIVGDLERSKYSGVDNTGIFASLGRVVHIEGDLMVIEIFYIT